MAPALTPRRAAVAVGLVAAAAGALTLNRHLVGIFYDDGLYTGLAWALAHGRGYVYPNLPGTPAAVHYPPLYPLVLAPLFGLLSVPAAALAGKVLNVACAAAACGLIAWHAVRSELLGPGAPPWLAAAGVAASALAIPFLALLTVLFSEPLFALLLAAAVILADRPPARWSPDAAAVLAGLAAALALLARSLGVAAGAGIVAWTYFAHRGTAPRRMALAALPLVLAGGAWGAWVLAHRHGIDPLLAPDYGSYFDIFRDAGPAVIVAGAADLARPLGVLVLSLVPSRAVYYTCGIPALAVGLYGIGRLTRRSSIGLTLIVYLAILAAWPVPPDRFLWAILPWLALAWASGAAGLWRYTRLRAPLLALVAVLAFGYARYEIRGFAGRWWDTAARQISDDFATLLPALDSLPPGAVIATDHDPLVWLYTRRSAVPLSIYGRQGNAVLEPPPAVHRAYLERQGVTHLIAGEGGGAAQQLQRLLDAYPGWLTAVHHWPGGRTLLEVRRER